MQTNYSFMRFLLDLFSDVNKHILENIKENLDVIAKIIRVASPILVILIVYTNQKQNAEYIMPFDIIFVPLFIEILASIIEIIKAYLDVKKEDEEKDDFPIPLKRYTKVEDNEVRIDREDLDMAILYLSEVEDYAEKEGLL